MIPTNETPCDENSSDSLASRGAYPDFDEIAGLQIPDRRVKLEERTLVRREAMERHRDNRRYSAWSLEATAELLARRFPDAHVWLVRPLKMTLGTFSEFANFLTHDAQGVPEFDASQATCLPQLSALLKVSPSS